jgi:hypothetical protein
MGLPFAPDDRFGLLHSSVDNAPTGVHFVHKPRLNWDCINIDAYGHHISRSGGADAPAYELYHRPRYFRRTSRFVLLDGFALHDFLPFGGAIRVA